MKLRDPTVATKRLFGRDELLDWLDRAVFLGQADNELTSCPLILLHGRKGMGKSAVCRKFVETHLAGSPNAQPLFVFEWKGGTQGRSVLRFSRLLFQMGRSNLPSEGPATDPAMIETPEVRSDLVAGTDQTYDEDGLAEEINLPDQNFADGDLAALAQEFITRILMWMDRGKTESRGHPLSKVIFVLDNFEDYHVSIRQWVGRYLYPLSKSTDALPNSAFLFTGERPWDECGFADYWEVPPGGLLEHRLDPLSPVDCKQWLESAGLPEEYTEVLIEETEGSPGRIAALIAQPDRLRAFHIEGNQEGQLGDFSAKQRRWLHAASMREVIPFELLEIILGRSEANVALAWLRQNPGICRLWVKGDYSTLIKIEPSLRSRILELASEKIPMRHEEFSSRLRLVDELSEKIPFEQHRKSLGMLSPIKPLSEEAIRYVYGEDR